MPSWRRLLLGPPWGLGVNESHMVIPCIDDSMMNSIYPQIMTISDNIWTYISISWLYKFFLLFPMAMIKKYILASQLELYVQGLLLCLLFLSTAFASINS